jgi:hypothetical protein
VKVPWKPPISGRLILIDRLFRIVFQGITSILDQEYMLLVRCGMYGKYEIGGGEAK